MRLFRRLAERRRRSGGADDGGRYVCTLCGARFDERAVVVCPECRGFVVRRQE
ncbi:hypothetical protein M0R88_08830 [Halorussus gelatinilyticus]|uniref:Rubrerythrin-like domain-containing protein n=1 Tax=Halorussus gelatinilyticus TaxID=2937524 RepID=A0A8U0IM14_9EURY|nr:hypothetical protein [Halorussus gelatinilyticus]UPW02183.1 hypothetical protein M0R88_08830 [Halorussus gelatinilyticus]